MNQYIKTTHDERIKLGDGDVSLMLLKQVVSEHCSQHNIKEIYIVKSALGDVGAEYVSDLVRKNKDLEVLHLSALSYNYMKHTEIRITAHGAFHLAQGLKTNKKVHTLNLMANDLGNTGAKHIADILPGSGIQRLNLSYNDIHSDGIGFIADKLISNTNVKCLHLVGNHTKTIGALYLGVMLQVNSTLMHIDLSDNALGHDGALPLSTSLIANKTMLSIVLKNNKLGAYGLELMASAIEQSASLAHVDISKNLSNLDEGAGLRPAYALSQAIKQSNTLISLDISGNHFCSQALGYFEDATYFNHETLDGCSLKSLKTNPPADMAQLEILQRIQINIENNKRYQAGSPLMTSSSASTTVLTLAMISNFDFMKESDGDMSDEIKREFVPIRI